ncbi:MAG: hypothetical protein MJ171_05295 [Clostridia bacterium]|nr:hypothetical protein [Clostridia bacterium]
MGLLLDLAKQYKVLSIVGMAKNAGKTTALNYLIEEAMDDGMILGITSTGRDGETEDLVTGTEKPRVYLDNGTIVSVPSQLFDLADAGLEIVERLPYSTSIGELLLCRVQSAGYVQIAGPVAAQDTKRMCRNMFSHGAEMVVIDGAIDRKSVAAPDTSDAVILATGAVLSRSMNKVVEETAHIVNLYSLPELEEGTARTLLEANITGNVTDTVMLIDKDNNLKKLNLTTGLGASSVINDEITEDTRYVYIPGAFTNSVFSDIQNKKFKHVRFILKDPTRIFVRPIDWNILRKKGFQVSVLKNIEIAAITVNPWAPLGYTFDSDALIQEMKKVIPDIPIVDVRK